LRGCDTIAIHVGETNLGIGITLRGRFLIPTEGQWQILLNTPADFV
jgi:hypothetical protein